MQIIFPRNLVRSISAGVDVLPQTAAVSKKSLFMPPIGIDCWLWNLIPYHYHSRGAYEI